MPYHYKREPLTQDEANRLANACQAHEEKLVGRAVLNSGLRISELVSLVFSYFPLALHVTHRTLRLLGGQKHAWLLLQPVA